LMLLGGLVTLALDATGRKRFVMSKHNTSSHQPLAERYDTTKNSRRLYTIQMYTSGGLFDIYIYLYMLYLSQGVGHSRLGRTINHPSLAR
jgi:hypothetical protein